MKEIYHFRELDDESRAYLRQIGACQGQGMNGLFVPDNDYALWGCLAVVGVAIIGAVFVYTNESLEDPVNVTCLQMAGLLMGGWFVATLIRRWFRAGAGLSAGSFCFADPVRIWCASDQWVTVIELSKVHRADVKPNYNEKGEYQNSTVTLIGQPPGHEFKIGSQERAQRLAGYITSHVGGDRPRSTEADLIPTPQRVRSQPSGLFACTIIAGLTVLGFVLLLDVNRAMHDDNVFNVINKNSAAEIRAYMLNPHRTRHRAEAEAALARIYQPAVVRLREAKTDPELGKAFADQIESLSTQTLEIFTLRVATKPQEPNKDEKGEADKLSLTERLEYDIGSALRTQIGEELVSPVRAPEDTPASLEIIVLVDSNEVQVSLKQAREDQRVEKKLPIRPQKDREQAIVTTIMLALTGTEPPKANAQK